MLDTNLCPCGSTHRLDQCCLPVIQGKKRADTAEQLLRARYTAFVTGDIDFILTSHHSKTRAEIKREEVEDWSKNSKWLELKIIQVEGGQSTDTQGNIIFGAYYEAEGKNHEHLEKSFFEKEKGEWKFLDAQSVQVGTFKRLEPKVGRNDACPCGSGKKYKKCCGN